MLKIQNCNPEMGFSLDNMEERLLLWKWEYWKKGIPAHQFWKEKSRDIKDIMDINNAVNNKKVRQQEIRKAMSGMKW